MAKGLNKKKEIKKPRNLEDIKPGGLGTFFINQIMDSVSFQLTSPDWVNCLTMKKKIK